MSKDGQKPTQQDGNNSALSSPFRTETYAEIKKRYSHDAFCKEKLRDLTKAKEFAKHILKPEAATLLDIDSLQIDPESYIDDELKQLFADVVYRIPIRGSDENIVVFILIELKTDNDKWTIFQLVKYVIRIWDRELKLAEKEKRLDTFLFPMVIPVIFHHGETAFTAPTELMTLVRVIQGLEEFTLNMKSILFDVTPLDENEFPENTELAAFLMVLQAVFSGDTMQKLLRILQKLRPCLHLPDVQKEWQDHLYYAVLSAKGFSREQCEEVYKKTNETGDVAMSLTLADQLFAEGEAIGEAKSIIRTLTKRFQTVPPATTEKVLGLTDLGEIEHLADFAYDCQTLHEFEVALNR